MWPRSIVHTAADRCPGRRTRALIRLVAGSALACLTIGCTDEPISPWHSLPTATDATFRDVFFLDDERGWIVGGGHAVDGGILGETLDGGATWTFRTGIVSNPRSRLFSLNAIHFWDERRGVIASTGGRLLRTVDGGENWHAQLGGAGRGLSDLFILDEALGWAAGEQWVLRTTDGGESWQRANAGVGSNDDFRARAIHFFDADRGILVGHHGAIRLTQDGGRSWEKADVSNDLGSTVLSAIDFVDERLGWVVGEAGTLLVSVDGGASWTLQPNPSRGDLNALEFVSPEAGWIAGYDRSTGISSIMNTRDGGATWSREAAIEGESLLAIHFLDADRGFAVGSRERRLPQRIFRYSAPSEP